MEAKNRQQSKPSKGSTINDTWTMAKQESAQGGLWEAEANSVREADLHRHLDGCKKNPGHLKFVPVDLFGVDYLPSGYQDQFLVDMIRTVSDLTVRVLVKYVSEGRPETFPGSGKPYPFYKNRGSDMMRVGTGWVGKVLILPTEISGNQTCGCKECLNCPTRKTHFAHIYIYTAAHVVWDDLEGADTTCHLFFDRGGTPGACEDVIALSGMSYVYSSIDDDISYMVCATHDLYLAHRLLKMVDHRLDLILTMKNIYYTRYSLLDMYKPQDSTLVPDYWDELTIIISHPHGCSKQISIGCCAYRDVLVDKTGHQKSMYTYTTATCPGSSGAPIIKIDRLDIFSGHVHSGNCDDNKELNHSCFSEDIASSRLPRRFMKVKQELALDRQEREKQGNTTIDTMTLARQEPEQQGLSELECSYEGEVDLHRRVNSCEKNPGHQKFIPVEEFNMDHLLPGYKDLNLVDLVRTMSDLTVRVLVKYVSERRPTFFPGSDKPYPCYMDRGKNRPMVGTGWVSNVLMFPMEGNHDIQTCECKECLDSPTPKTQFAHIYIFTAAHVAYDDQEGAHTTCHLFFDRGGTPNLCDNVITLSNMAYMWTGSSINTDSSLMVYATHDLDLVDKLLTMVHSRFDLMCTVKKIYSKRYSHPAMYNQQDSRHVPDHWKKLAIIVSHPHGCSKMISVGYCTRRDVFLDETGDEKSMYTYNTATCTGSSGAPIFILGPGWQELPSGHVHSGNLENNKDLNFSCNGEDFIFFSS